MRSSKALSLFIFFCTAALHAQSWRGPAALGLQVTQEDGQPIAGAAVILQFLETDPPVGLPTIFTDLDGRVALWGLAEGEWQVDVRSEGYMLYSAVVLLRRGKAPKTGFSSQQRTGSFWAPLKVNLFEVTEPPPSPSRRRPTQPPAEPPAPSPEVQERPEEEQPSPTEAEEAPAVPQPEAIAAAIPEPETSEPQSTPAAPSEPTATEVQTPPAAPPPAPEPETAAAQTPATTPPQAETEPQPAPPPSAQEERPAAPAPAAPRTEEPETRATEPRPAAPLPSPEPPRAPARPEIEETPRAQPPQPTPAAEPAPAPELEPAPEPAPAPEPKVPAPRVPAVSAEPGLVDAATAADIFRRAASYLRSSRHGTCVECQPGEWSAAAEQTAAAGAASCSPGVRDEVQAVAGQLADLGGVVATFAGPLADPRGGGLLDLLDVATRKAVRERLEPHLDRSAPCQLLAVVIPQGARYVGFRYEAGDTFQSGDCLPERECPVGQARWLANPGIERTSAFTLVWALFHNRSTDLQRRARLTVYFDPPGTWAPLGFR